MRERWEEAYLRDMAAKCRKLADRLIDERAASSLLKLAEEYEAALNAELELKAFNGRPR